MKPAALFGERDVQRFTEGDCHVLARALHLRTGWPIMAFVDKHDDQPDLHAFVLMPDGRALDVQGAVSMQAFKRRWKRSEVAEFNWKTLRSAFASPAFGRYSYQRAGVVAERLLAHLEVS